MAVAGHTIRGERDNVRFFRIPAETHFKHKVHLNELSSIRRQKWVNAINRIDWTASKLKYSKVCSKHFISGKSADLVDNQNPDWVPSVAMGYGNSKGVKRQKGQKALQRKARVQNDSIKAAVLIDNPTPSMEDVSQEQHTSDYNPNDKCTQTDITAEDFSNLISLWNLHNPSKQIGGNRTVT